MAFNKKEKNTRPKAKKRKFEADKRQYKGRLSIQRQGMGFVTPEKSNAGDIYIHPNHLGGAWHGDRVLVQVLAGQKGKSIEGRIIEVLERKNKELVVRLLPQQVQEGGSHKRLGRPVDTRSSGYVLVDLSSLPEKAGDGDMVLAAFESCTNKEEPAFIAQQEDGIPRVRALTLMGGENNELVYERMVKANHTIATEFPVAVLEESSRLPKDPDVELALAFANTQPEAARRRDLRELNLVTIDGADAEDFDDAVCVKSTPNGFVLWVAIADVGHYVPTGSALDREAANRGNSCYFPASVEPMLPQELSDGLCSLLPHRPRLTMVAQMEMDKSGRTVKSSFYPALIQSKARLTYEKTEQALNGKLPNLEDEGFSPAIMEMLHEASSLAKKLISLREKRGTLAFDLPEPVARIDADGKVVSFSFRQRLFSHRIVEEFMIAANEAVASYLQGFSAGGPHFLYRAHAAPDLEKLNDMLKVLANAGLSASLPPAPEAKDLQGILATAQGTTQEFVVNRLLLRSLMQARYTPLAEGHFGLASEAYCHFTSPIRRYADLCVHRALRKSLGLQDKVFSFAHLTEIAESINDAERNAISAEREIYKICAALYLQGREGERFSGYISGLTSFGLFVELADLPVEGFVRVESITDDFYRYVPEKQLMLGERQGGVFRLGQSVEVELVESSPARQEITMRLTCGAKGQKLATLRLPSAGKKKLYAPHPGKRKKTKREKVALKGSVRVGKKGRG